MNENLNSAVYLLSTCNSWELHEHLYCGGIDTASYEEEEKDHLKCSVCGKVLHNNPIFFLAQLCNIVAD